MNHLKILVADDDKKLCENISKILKLDLYSVDQAFNGQEVLDLVEYTTYDLLVLDWMMPKVSGMDVIKKVRKDGFEGGVILLTAMDATENIIEGLDQGADDYIVKPFKMEELRARVRACLRRKNKMLEEEIQYGTLTLNKNKRSISVDNIELNLTKNEFLLMEYLIANKNQVLTHEQLIDYIWDIDDNANTNTLAALVRLVRKKIDVEEGDSYIQSIRGIGYKLRER